MPIADPCALLNTLLKTPRESEWLEFKKSYFDHEQTGKNISALANSAMLYERDRAFIVWGVDNASRAKEGTKIRLANQKVGKTGKKPGENFSNWVSRKLRPQIRLEFEDFECEGLKFSIIEIEPTYSRPVSFDDIEYVRVTENTRKLSDHEELARAIWLNTSRHRFEGAIAIRGLTLAQVLGKLDVDAHYQLLKHPRPKSDAEVVRDLCQRKFLRDSMSGTYDITNLGAILLAKKLSDFPTIAGKAARLIKYLGPNKLRSEPEWVLDRGYAAGFENFREEVVRRVSEELTSGGLRTVVSLYPADAIREIVANSLVHQDFTISGAGPMVEIFSNRLEVSNPGASLIEPDRIINERRSRNEKLAEAMRDYRICEERGSGLDKTMIAIEAAETVAPAFLPMNETMRVVLPAPKKFKEMTKDERLRCLFYHCALGYANHEFMTNASLRARFSLPQSDYQAVSALITEAKRKGRIAPADPDQGSKGARYIPYWAA